MLKKKNWANFQRIIQLFTPKIVTKLSKLWVWFRDPRSGIWEKTYSGSRGQKGTGSRIRNTDFFLNQLFVGILNVNDENIRILIHQSEAWIRGSGFTTKCHESATLLYTVHLIMNRYIILSSVQYNVPVYNKMK